MKKIRVMVTGAGSGVGQGIIKALRASSLSVTAIAADIHPLNAGLFRADESVIIPKSEEDDGAKKMISSIQSCAADAVFIGSEYDLRFFSQNKELIENKAGALVLVSPFETIRVTDDKFLTAQFLKENNLPFPETYIARDEKELRSKAQKLGYPLILKPRVGTSSRHVHLIESEADLLYHYSRTPDPMIQKLIDRPSGALKNEYTCSVFKCSDGKLLGPFTAKRTLRGGHSWVIEVRKFEKIYDVLLAIGKKLDVTGPLNVQLMSSGKEFVPFEINCRFSGTTAVRAHFGFNEPEMALRHFLLKEELVNPVIGNGMAFRYSEEVFVDECAPEDFSAKVLPKGRVRAWF